MVREQEREREKEREGERERGLASCDFFLFCLFTFFYNQTVHAQRVSPSKLPVSSAPSFNEINKSFQKGTRGGEGSGFFPFFFYMHFGKQM